MPTSAALGVLAVAVASLLFAVNGTVAKLAMQAGLSPTRLVELRSVGSAIILITLALVVVRGRMRLRARELWVMALLGVAAALGAALSLATYYLLGARLVAQRDPLSAQAWSLGFAGIFWLVLQPFWTFRAGVLADDVALPGALDGVTAPLWVLVAWIVVLGTVVPYTLVLAGLQVIGAARAGLIGMIEPVAASAAAWLVLGEAMTAVQLVGGVVVLAGVALAETARRAPRTATLPDTIAV